MIWKKVCRVAAMAIIPCLLQEPLLAAMKPTPWGDVAFSIPADHYFSEQALSPANVSPWQPLLSGITRTRVITLASRLRHMSPANRARAILILGVIGFAAHFPTSNFAWAASTDRLAGLVIMFAIAAVISFGEWYRHTTPDERSITFAELRRPRSELRGFARRIAAQGTIIWGINSLLFITAISLGWISAEEFALLQGCGMTVGIVYDLVKKKNDKDGTYIPIGRRVAGHRWIGALLLIGAAIYRFHFVSASPLPLVVPTFLTPLLHLLSTFSSSIVTQMKILGYAAVSISTTLFVLSNIDRIETTNAMKTSENPAVQSFHKHFPFAAGILDYAPSALLIAVVKTATVIMAKIGWMSASQAPLWHWAFIPAAILIAYPFFFVNWSIPRTESMVFVPLFDTLTFWVMGWVYVINGMALPPAAGIAASVGVLGSYTAALGFPLIKKWRAAVQMVRKSLSLQHLGFVILYGLFFLTQRSALGQFTTVQFLIGLFFWTSIFSGLILLAKLLYRKALFSDGPALAGALRQNLRWPLITAGWGALLQCFNVLLMTFVFSNRWGTQAEFTVFDALSTPIIAVLAFIVYKDKIRKHHWMSAGLTVGSAIIWSTLQAGIGLNVTGLQRFLGLGMFSMVAIILSVTILGKGHLRNQIQTWAEVERPANARSDAEMRTVASARRLWSYFPEVISMIEYIASFLLIFIVGPRIAVPWFNQPGPAWAGLRSPIIILSAAIATGAWWGMNRSQFLGLGLKKWMPTFNSMPVWVTLWSVLLARALLPAPDFMPAALVASAMTIWGAYSGNSENLITALKPVRVVPRPIRWALLVFSVWALGLAAVHRGWIQTGTPAEVLNSVAPASYPGMLPPLTIPSPTTPEGRLRQAVHALNELDMAGRDGDPIGAKVLHDRLHAVQQLTGSPAGRALLEALLGNLEFTRLLKPWVLNFLRSLSAPRAEVVPAGQTPMAPQSAAARLPAILEDQMVAAIDRLNQINWAQGVQNFFSTLPAIDEIKRLRDLPGGREALHHYLFVRGVDYDPIPSRWNLQPAVVSILRTLDQDGTPHGAVLKHSDGRLQASA